MTAANELARPVRLSLGERRRVLRLRAGLTMQAVASMRGIRSVRGDENDPRDAGPLLLTQPEWCRLQRERAGLTLGQVSERLGLSTAWINRAERGLVKDIGALVRAWERNA